MIDAIVYVSNTGFTKKYADMLSAETMIPCFSLSEAAGKVREGSNIVFLGWLLAGKIKGYNKARKRYSIKAVAGVGMRSQTPEALSDLIKQNQLDGIPSFYLQGGLNMNKLHGLNKIALKIAIKAMSGSAAKDEEAKKAFDMVKNGSDYVSISNLNDLLNWCTAHK